VTRAALVLALLLGWAGPAFAQSTGGSFGGGSFSGGGGGDSGGGGGGYNGGGGYSTSDSYSSHSGSGGPGLSTGWVLLAVAGGLGVTGLATVFVSKVRRGLDPIYVPEPLPVDVTVLRIALDARVRPFVQKELDRIARTSDTKTNAGLQMSLAEVARLLRRLRDAWVYGGAVNEDLRDRDGAQTTFQRHVANARATFQHELVRNHDGVVTTAAAPPSVKRAEEGGGLVLVTLVVAAKQELFTVKEIASGDDLRRALEVLCAFTGDILVAMEIIWTPADPDDRMSSVELEALLPGAIFPIPGAMVGKLVCAYCAAPFPKELGGCPSCGAAVAA
jgi:uncharacterized membrane protein